MHVRSLGTLTTIVSAMVVLDALITPAILSWGALLPESYTATILPIADQVDLATICLRIATLIVFGRWIYVAGDNLKRAGYDDLEFTPASRIWWFAVPFACLVKPFQGMRELWNASHGNSNYQEGNGLVSTWWALWLLGTLVTLVTNRMASTESGTMPYWIDAAAGLPLAAVAILMIHRIAEAQTGLAQPALAEVFA
jgi:hypothetical protein